MSTIEAPYLGPETFELRHRELFFGRSAEGRVVASMIGSEPVTILTGASGTGKSSLLRAQIMPTLQSRGWCSIYAQPQGDPIAALREELIEQCLPRASDERQSIETLLEEAQKVINPDTSLADARAWFAGLAPSDPRRGALIEPTNGTKIPRYSLMARMLAGLATPTQAAAQISALAAFAGAHAPIGPDWTLADVLGQLDAAASGREALERLLRPNDGSLLDLVERISVSWVEPLEMLGLVLVLDQAEELYTAFGASHGGASTLHDWQLREALFEEIRKFSAFSTLRPIRFCFSLRPEWYAMLRVSISQSIRDENQSAYFLSRFERQHGREAIVEPALLFGGAVEPDAVDYALDELSRDTDRNEIDPFLLAITFYRAWRIAEQESDGRIRIGQLEDIASLVTPPSLIGGAIKSLLDHGVAELEPSEEFDCIMLLASLFNEDRSRRIVPEGELVNRPLRDKARLQGLLVKLDEAGLIRRFKRSDLTLVEVRHERMSLPVFDRLHQIHKSEDHGEVQQRKGRFRSLLGRALSHLMTFNGAHLDNYIAGGLEEDPLPAWASITLRSNYEDVAWDQAAARTLLASLLHSGPESWSTSQEGTTGTNDREALPDWEEWRKLVAYLMPVATRRLELSSEEFAASQTLREQMEATILRGAQVDPDTADACLRQGLRDLTPDTRLAFMRSIATAPRSNETACREMER